jgi:hypothetical protein
MFGFQQNQTSTLFNTNKGANYDDNLGCGFSKQANLNGIVSDRLVCLVDASKQDFVQKKNNKILDLINTSSVTLNSGAYVQDYYSGCVFLDGVDDNVIISNSSKYGDNIGTWSIWCYYSVYGTDKMSLINRHSSQSASGIIITINSTNQLCGVTIYSSSIVSSVLSLTSPINSLIKNKWNNISITFNNNKTFRLYINGVLLSSSIPSGTWSFNNQNIILGTSIDTFWNKFNGKIANVQIYNKELSANEIMQNYNALAKRFNKINEYFDYDIENFILSAQITNLTQQSAITTLITSLKNNGLWDKFYTIYPFIGGTATSHKFNLKDARDLDSAYRLSFLGGGWIHNSNGITPNGSTSYANTFIRPSTIFNTTDLNHLSYYSKTDSAVGFEYTMGVATTGLSTHGLIIRRDTNLAFFASDYGTGVTYRAASNTNSTNGQGFFIGTQQGTSIKLYRNTTVLSSNTSLTLNTSPASDYMSIGGINVNGTTQNFTNKTAAFASIGKKLTDSEVTTFYNIVQAYQTTLGRQV